LLELKKLHSYSIEASLPEKPRINPACERGEASPIPLDLVIFFSDFFERIALGQKNKQLIERPESGRWWCASVPALSSLLQLLRLIGR
jgi:hypothetical protein